VKESEDSCRDHNLRSIVDLLFVSSLPRKVFLDLEGRGEGEGDGRGGEGNILSTPPPRYMPWFSFRNM